jgi:hypothetical protein
MLSFSISYPFKIKSPYFVDNTDLRLKERFGGERRPKERSK